MSKPPIALEARKSEEARLFSPSAGRNKADISTALAEILPVGASVLEIGSGTGEHGIATVNLRPDLTWQFSDPDDVSRASQLAWSEHSEHDFPAPLNLNMEEPASRAQVTTKYDAIFSANMIHIAPISALHGLAALAGQALGKTGKMILYGPFLTGESSAPSNLDFDVSLKRRNPAWGVRDLDAVKHIFAKQGFNDAKLCNTPKNNFILEMSRR